ncbi:MAG: hypothetical protein IJA51_01735 [Oscillospiraceae bacterium]|nr:hypothetical protein [Oscillospiraceae bacterium]
MYFIILTSLLLYHRAKTIQHLCGYHRVTYVLVNSPDTGYGIFIENMLEAAG